MSETDEKPFEVFTHGGHFVGRYATEKEAHQVMSTGKRMVLRVKAAPIRLAFVRNIPSVG